MKRKKVEKREKRVPRLKARLREGDEKYFYKIEVESEEDLEKLGEWLDTPIMEEKRGQGIIIDVRDRLLFYKSSEL